MYFSRQDTCLQQFVGRIEIEIICRHHITHFLVHIGLDDLVDHAQLIAQLAVSTGLIQDPQAVIPETTAYGQDGIVLREVGYVILAVADCCAIQVTCNLSHVCLHHSFDDWFGFRRLGQDDLADDCINIGIR